MTIDKNKFKEKQIFFICLSILFSSSCSKLNPSFMGGKKQFPQIEVEVIKVEKSSLVKRLQATGALESPQTTELTSEIAGKIIYLNIPEGELVSEGHVLARVNNTTNKAEIEVAKAKFDNANTNYNRMKTLKEQGAISQQSLDNTLEDFSVAKGEFERVGSIYSMTQIIAPFSGVLSIKKISLGQYIDPGDPIVRISQINPIYLVFNLPEQYVSQVKLGQNVRFEISGLSKEYFAKINVIDPYIDPDTRSVKIRATVQNPKRELLPGGFANVSLEISSIPDAISIPEEALIQSGDKKQVVVVQDDNTTLIKDVTVSEWGKGSVIVSSGLMVGDVVIILGNKKLRPESKVLQNHFTP